MGKSRQSTKSKVSVNLRPSTKRKSYGKKRQSTKSKLSSKRTSSTKLRTSGKYSHIKPGQTVILKNGACIKRLSNQQFRFVKKKSCRKTKKGGGEVMTKNLNKITSPKKKNVKKVMVRVLMIT